MPRRGKSVKRTEMLGVRDGTALAVIRSAAKPLVNDIRQQTL